MRTLSLQQMPHGFELETPSFTYWLKAGIGFSFGALVVYIAGIILWLALLTVAPSFALLRAFRLV